MKDISQTPIVKKTLDLCDTLVNLRIKEEHDVTVKLYNAKSDSSPACEHCMTGSTDHSVIKAVAAIGALALVTTAFCTACSLIRN